MTITEPDFGINPLGPSRKVKAAIRKATRNIGSRSDDSVAWFERLLQSRFGAGHDNILPANSMKELIYFIPRVLRPSRILIIGPAPDIYRDAAVSAGGSAEVISGREEDCFMPDTQAVLEKIKGCDMVIAASPNRLTGRSCYRSAMEDIVSSCPEGCVVLLDESLAEFADRAGLMGMALGTKKVIVLRTTACYFGLPGLELAYAVSSPELIGRLGPECRWKTSLLSVEAARTALKDKAFARLTSEFVKNEKALLKKAADRLPGVVCYESDSNVFLMRIPGKAREVVRAAGQYGLSVLAGSAADGIDEACVSVALLRHEHNLRFIKLLKRMFAG